MKGKIIKEIPSSFWLNFTNIILILCIVALFGSVLFSLTEEDWNLFLYTLVSVIAVSFQCAVIQILVKIEKNTRKTEEAN